jgi:hypothetical protein
VSDAHNCSVCFKCARTLLTLELLGHLTSFNKVFDRQYSRIREGYVAHVRQARRVCCVRLPTCVRWTAHAWGAHDRTLTNMAKAARALFA